MIWIFLALGSAVFHALGSIANKKVMRHEHALEFGASTGLLSVLLVFALPFVDLGFSWQLYVAIYATSIIFCAGNLYYLKSLRHSQLSSAIPLMNISPIFLLVIAFLFLGEQPSGLDILGVFLLIVGTYVLQMATSGKHFLAPFKTLIKSKYALYMIFAMVIFSVTATMEKGIINSGVSALAILVVGRIFVGFNYVMLESFKYGFKQIVGDYKKDGKGIVLSWALTMTSNVFYFTALATPGALVSLIIPVKRTSTLIASLIGGKFFHEDKLAVKGVACVIMIIGVTLVVL